MSGDIDFHTAPGLRGGGLELIEQGHHRLILDLSAVEYCDSSGLSTLIGLWHAARGAGGSFALTGIHTILPIHATTADALAAHR
ncbi:STAS domain-containing protein [Streptomyces sp. cmx-4-7]|uniref:STAS domain-containing protein n=1 Tax=Streptomyces sp. cmx-4-7 TaxID=2790939 RepID=UPI00398188E6